MLRAQFFGRPRLLLDDVPLTLAGRPKVVPLLAYLLVHRAQALERRIVANALWPDVPEDHARANLRRHLNYVAQVLPPPAAGRPWIVSEAGRLQWNPLCAAQLDVEEFAIGCEHPQRLDAALDAYAGDFMAGFDDDWIERERERLRAVLQCALERALAARRAAGDVPGALAAARRLLREDPWREDVLRSLMMLAYHGGDRAGALAEYDRFTQALQSELATEPMPETRALHAAIVRDTALPAALNDAAPAAASAPARPAWALPFAGRATELDTLLRWLDAASAGHGAALLLAGEAGIGKTRLLREFAAACSARGAQVWMAGCSQPEPVPYEPFLRIVRAALPLAAEIGLERVWQRALAPFTAAPPADERAMSVDSGRRRLRLFEACANLLATLGSRRTAVVMVDDVHWAGTGTLAMLEHLARGSAQRRLLVLAAYREDEAATGAPVPALRARLEREGAVFHLALARLDRQAVAEIARALAPEANAAFADDVYARSEGSPLVIEALLRERDERAAGDGDVPGALRELIAARLARASPRARALAEIAAVAGPGFDLDLLTATTGWREATVLDALGELIDRRLVEENATAASAYAFSHHLIQTAVYETLAHAVRVRRHRRIAHVLGTRAASGRDVPAAALALHWDRGGEPERAARHYVAAAREALRVFGNDEAAAHLTRALELPLPGPERIEALLLDEQIAAARGERARQAADLLALARLTGTDHAAAGTILERRVALANVTGDRRRERVLLALLERRLRHHAGARARAGFLEARARYHRSLNEFEAARAAFAELQTLAERTHDRSAHAAARLAIADSYIYEGRLDEARQALTALQSALSAQPDREAMVRTLLAFARAALVQQDYAVMGERAAEALALAREAGDREGEALALHTMANGLVYSFRVAQTAALHEAAREIYERIGHRVGLAGIAVDMGLFRTELGQFDAALEHFRRARTLASQTGFRFVACTERLNAGYCHRLRGDAAASLEAAHGALELARDIASAPLESAALGVLGAAQSAFGDHAAALANLRAGVELRRPAGATPRLGDNLCALALAALAAGRPETARAACDELASLYDGNPRLAPQPTEWLWAMSEVEAAQGRAGAARRRLRQAQSVMRARAAAIADPDACAAYLDLPFNRAVRSGLAATGVPRRSC